MTKAERRAKLKIDLARADWFKLRHAELVKSGMTEMAAFNQAHLELSHYLNSLSH